MISTSNNQNEKLKIRKPRIKVKESVIIKPTGKQSCQGYVVNLSESGAFLLSKEIFSPDTKLLIYMPLGLPTKKRFLPHPSKSGQSRKEQYRSLPWIRGIRGSI